ncbi:DAN domain family member 5 [Erinaceus europaeus]|uniref:DAN domain family member 5 n=1 Tax=Erinaceus europaeus TaxID=9365 RepID=A0A1S3ABL9_ERIEU|nr:DAN domain family member 5 [Erinaceus europaeus]
MFAGHLAPVLGLLSGSWLPTGEGLLAAREPPATPQTPGADPRGLSAEVVSWAAFLDRQKRGRLGTRGSPGSAVPVSLPLDPQVAAWESCKAVSFTQVLSRPGCLSTRLRNRVCFGHCSSLYVPGSNPGPTVLCNACTPVRQHRVPVALWCRGPGASRRRRRVETSALVIDGCRCTPRA